MLTAEEFGELRRIVAAKHENGALHSGVTSVLRYFAFGHLAPELQAISRPFAEMAYTLAASDLSGPELTMGLRKLLESKDCIVRAALDV